MATNAARNTSGFKKVLYTKIMPALGPTFGMSQPTPLGAKRYVDDNRGQQQVQTGTRKVVSGFKNVPVGTKNVMIDNGRPGTPRVIWKTETINNSPAWISRALHNNIKHDRSVNTFQTTEGSPVTSKNQGPVATNDSTKVECGKSVAINVLVNDTDANNDNDLLNVRLHVTFISPRNNKN